MGCDCLDRLLSLDRFQRDPGLHLCTEAPSLLRPRLPSCSVARPRFYTLFTGPIFGEHLTVGTIQIHLVKLTLGGDRMNLPLNLQSASTAIRHPQSLFVLN